MLKISFPEKFHNLPDIRYSNIVDFSLDFRNEWHNSRRSDLIYIISGDLTVLLSGSIELQYPASAGDILIMKGNLPHKDIFKTVSGLKALIVSYKWAGDEEFFSAGKVFSIRKFESAKNNEVRWQLEKMRESLALKNSIYCDNMLANSRLHTILLLLYSNMLFDKNDKAVMTYRLEELLYAAEHYINCNYNSPNLTRTKVAEALNVSVPTLSRAFEYYSGYTFLEYLTQVRLEAAKKLLLDGNFRISETAQMCGFSDPSYFARVFKKTFGIPPGKYR